MLRKAYYKNYLCQHKFQNKNVEFLKQIVQNYTNYTNQCMIPTM